MLPLSLLKTAQGHPMLVELKNGETYNGHLVNCDSWMNIHLREVICTSKVTMETGFGECRSVTSGGIQSSICECQMRSLIKFRKRPRVVQIGSPLGEVVEEEEVEKMALGGRLKALVVVWMMEVKVPVAEAVVVLVERLVGKLEAEGGENLIVSAEALGMAFVLYF